MKPPKFYRLFDYDRSRLPNAHLRSLEEGVADLETARLRSGLTIGYPGWSLIYDLAVSAIDPDSENVIVETGSNWGCTTIVLAQALIDRKARGHVWTVEIDPENAARARQNYETAGVADRITLVEGDAKSTVAGLVKDLAPLRFAFLDGCHLHDDVVVEFEGVVDHLAPGALVVFDNTYQIAEPHEDQRVNGALKTIVSRHGGNLINFPFVSWYTPGVAIWQKAPFPA